MIDQNPFASPWPNRVAGIAVGLLLAFVLYLGVVNYRLGVQGAETHAAVCQFKLDLVQRHAVVVKFLKEHPQGIPGINRAAILDGLHKQQATIDSLDPLHC